METYKDLYPEGNYKVRALGMIAKEGKSGNPYLEIKVEVLEPRSRQTDVVPGGHRYIKLFPMSEAKREETLEFLNGAGLAASGVGSIEEFDPTGFEFVARCKHEEYNGKTSDRFEIGRFWSLEPQVGTGWMQNATPVNRTKLASMNAMLGIAKKGWKPAQTAAAPVRRDGVPF